MQSYKLLKDRRGVYASVEVLEVEHPTFIPFDENNRDCQRFVGEWQAGASVVDEDGTELGFHPNALGVLGIAGIVPLVDEVAPPKPEPEPLDTGT